MQVNLCKTEYSAYDSDAWISQLKDFIRQVDATTNSKILGICFGHQIIAEALGGKVEKNTLGWEIGWTPLQVNPQGLEWFGKNSIVIKINLEYSTNASSKAI